MWAPRPPKAARPPKAKLPPIRHRRDGSTLLSVLLVLVGLAWLASEIGIFTVSLEAVLATALAVLGASMVVTARTDWSLSRRHWPVWVGMGMLVVLLVSANGSAIQDSLSSLHFGPVSSTPTAWKDVGGTISNLAGPVDLDLTQLPPAGAMSADVRVRDTFGPIQVTIPTIPASAPYRLEIRARTAFGPVNLPGQAASAGTFSTKVADYGSPDPKAPVVTLVLNDVFGPVTVVQRA